MDRACSTYGERRDAYSILVGKPEGKRPISETQAQMGGNIQSSLQEVKYWGMDWIELAEDKDRWRVFVTAVMNLQVPKHAGNFSTT